MDRSDCASRPKRRDTGLIVREIGPEIVVYDLDRHRAHCLNPEAARLWQACDGLRDSGAILRHLHGDAFGEDHETALAIGLEDLARNHLLEGDADHTVPGVASDARTNRRQLLATFGKAAAVTAALPAIMTIVSPTPAEAASCLASGSACTSSSQCCSGLCMRGTCA